MVNPDDPRTFKEQCLYFNLRKKLSSRTKEFDH